MDNKAIAGILYETAALLEIDGQDSFRIRSYRNAADSIEALPQQISDLINEPKKVLEIQGIGKGMLANLQEIFKEGRLSVHSDLLKKYRPSMLELLRVIPRIGGRSPWASSWPSRCSRLKPPGRI